VSFREPNGVVIKNMKPQRGRSIAGPSLRGLWGRSATGQNGRAAANKEVSAVWSRGWMSENIRRSPTGRSVFLLTSLFIGLTEVRSGFTNNAKAASGVSTRSISRWPSSGGIAIVDSVFRRRLQNLTEDADAATVSHMGAGLAPQITIGEDPAAPHPSAPALVRAQLHCRLGRCRSRECRSREGD
jgi:hypothetical protein